MAHHFGLSPDQVWELTSAEYKAFHDFLDELRKAQE